jgi:hypothetical protein
MVARRERCARVCMDPGLERAIVSGLASRVAVRGKRQAPESEAAGDASLDAADTAPISVIMSPEANATCTRAGP